MRVPEFLKSCVCFLCIQKGHNQNVFSYGGTAFFVSVPSETIEDGRYGYIVTARHNVEIAKNYGDLYIRINTQDGGSRNIQITDEWIYSENEAADVAVAPLRDTVGLDATAVSIKAFVTDEILRYYGIGIGEDLFITGLFT